MANRDRISSKYKEDLSFKAFIIEMYDMSNERVARGERKSVRATA
jgi:hypothetical protein